MQEKRVIDSNIEEPDEVKFVVNDWYEDNGFYTYILLVLDKKELVQWEEKTEMAKILIR